MGYVYLMGFFYFQKKGVDPEEVGTVVNMITYILYEILKELSFKMWERGW